MLLAQRQQKRSLAHLKITYFVGPFILAVNSSTAVTYLVLFDSLNNPMRWVEASFPFYKEDMLREATLLFGNPDPLISDPAAFPTNNILANTF